MLNHEEMFQALLNGETLCNIKGTCEYKLMQGRIYYFNIQNSTCWTKCNGIPHFSKVQVKQKYIVINGIEVPEPLRVASNPMDYGYVVALNHLAFADGKFIFTPSKVQFVGKEEYLKAGLIHSTPEAAQAHIDALLSFTNVS